MSFQPERSVRYVKASACGNDFLLIEGAAAPDDKAAFTRAICDRNNGVGADGVEFIYEPTDRRQADMRIRLVNADGSEAEISGNGTRCVAAWLVAHHGVISPRIETDAGIKSSELVRRDANVFEFVTDMGAATVGKEVSLQMAGATWQGLEVSLGNPHFVTFVDSFDFGWQKLAQEASHHRHFPEGTNVELVRAIGKSSIEIRIFERGAGETLSSGTGSSASAAAAIATGRAESPLEVIAPGGKQKVTLRDGRVFLTGPATLVCWGEYFL